MLLQGDLCSCQFVQDMLTVIGKERKSENIKRKILTGTQGQFQRTDTLETKEKDKL